MNDHLSPTSAGAGRPVLFLGTFDPATYRNASFCAMLDAAGVDHDSWTVPIWTGDRVATAISPSPQTAARIAVANLRLIGRVLRSARRLRPAVVQVNYPGYFDVLPAVLARRLTGARLVYDPFISLYDTVVDDRRLMPPTSWKARLIDRIDRAMFERADVVLADCSAHVDYYTSRFETRPDAVQVLHVGANEAVFVPTERERPDEDVFVVHTHSTFIPLHGIPAIVRAAALLRDLPIRFEIVGEGQEFDAVRRFVEEEGLDNVVLPGRVPQTSLPRRIADADLCLGAFGSSDKASRVIPQKVFEYMAVGTAVLTQESPSLGADLTSVVLTCGPQPEQIADTIRTAAADRDDLRARGRRGREIFADRYSAEVIGQRYRNLIGV